MKRSRPRGFTLLEVLVAMSILLVVSALGYRGFSEVLRVQERVDDERQFWQKLSMTFLRLQQDLSQARARPVRDEVGKPLPALIGNADSPEETGLEFSCGDLDASEGSLRTDVGRVAYRLEGRVLNRLAWPVLDRAPQTAPQSAAMLDGVEAFRARYFSTKHGWTRQWPFQGNSEPLPRGTEVTLLVAGRGEFTRTFFIHDDIEKK